MRLSFRRRRRERTPVLVGGNAVTLLHDGAQCLPAMLDAIGAARSEIALEMYWFASDRTGRTFARALCARAREGVKVRVIYDAVGSWEADGRMFEQMRAAGCQVYVYHPIAPFRHRFSIGVVNRRDHRKILVVDGLVGFTGGVNLGDPWAAVEEGGLGFRDAMIRVEGPAALHLRELFHETWIVLGGVEPSPGDLPGVREEGEPGSSPVQVLANFRGGVQKAIRGAYLERIAAARRFVFITNSYFVPDRAIRNALARAAARGVDVRVLVPGQSDVFAVYWAGRKLYGWLLEHGIRVLEWQRTVLHAKTAVIDGTWCTVGTYNLDYRSLRFNLEVTVTVEDAMVGEAMRARFEQDLRASVGVQLRHHRFRPLSDRLLERFFYLFRKLL